MATERGLWLVVTGTGRCGTKFVSEVLNSVGVKCTHQGLFQPHMPWSHDPPTLITPEEMGRQVAGLRQARHGWEAESSWCAAPFLGLPEMEGVTVVHVVRHPKRTIDSLVKVEVFEERKRYGQYVDFAYEHAPEMREQGTRQRRAAAFYVAWNRMIEPHADVFWRVEDDPRGLLDRLGVSYEGKEIYNDTTCNGRGGPRSDVRLADFGPALRADLLEMAGRYGYEWSE